jgi:hypothetical protein
VQACEHSQACIGGGFSDSTQTLPGPRASFKRLKERERERERVGVQQFQEVGAQLAARQQPGPSCACYLQGILLFIRHTDEPDILSGVSAPPPSPAVDGAHFQQIPGHRRGSG